MMGQGWFLRSPPTRRPPIFRCCSNWFGAIAMTQRDRTCGQFFPDRDMGRKTPDDPALFACSGTGRASADAGMPQKCDVSVAQSARRPNLDFGRDCLVPVGGQRWALKSLENFARNAVIRLEIQIRDRTKGPIACSSRLALRTNRLRQGGSKCSESALSLPSGMSRSPLRASHPPSRMEHLVSQEAGIPFSESHADAAHCPNRVVLKHNLLPATTAGNKSTPRHVGSKVLTAD